MGSPPPPPNVCYISCQPMPCYVQVPMIPCPPPPPPTQNRPPPSHYQPPPPPPCCRPPSGQNTRAENRGGAHPSCICYPAPPAAGLPSTHNANIGHRNANGQRNEKTGKCPTCGHGSAKEVADSTPRREMPSDYGTPGALSTPGAGCKGPPCLTRSVCPAPCQPQFPPMLPCCTTKCPPGPCPAPGTSLMVGMEPPEPKCKPCCGKPPGCSPASEFPAGGPGPCEPCLWPPLCLRS